MFGSSLPKFFPYFVLTSLSPKTDLHLQVSMTLLERIIEINKESWLCSFKCSVIQLCRLDSTLSWNACRRTLCAIYVQWHTDSIFAYMYVLTYVQKINLHSLRFSLLILTFFAAILLKNFMHKGWTEVNFCSSNGSYDSIHFYSHIYLNQNFTN